MQGFLHQLRKNIFNPKKKMKPLIEDIFRVVVASLPQSFTYVLGDAIEINNKTEELDFPVFGFESTTVGVEFLMQGEAVHTSTSCVLYVLYKSELDEIAEDRQNDYRLAETAFAQFLDALMRVRYVDNVLEVVPRNEPAKLGRGQKVVAEVQSATGLRVKNVFTSNSDGLLINGLKIKLYDLVNYCA
jgi:hypothetical protein